MSAQLDRLVNPVIAAAVARFGLGGLAIAVVGASERPAFYCSGVSDIETRRLIDETTGFRIASISKTMTALAVMQLRDSGCLDLDDPVNDYLKALRVRPPAGGPEVTVRHLLTHTSGIGELPRIADIARLRKIFGIAKPGSPPTDLCALYRGLIRPEVPAGTKWAYANHGFNVLTQLVEDVAGVPFADFQRQRLFDPLGMVHTDYVRNERVAPSLAAGHRRRSAGLQRVKDYELTLLGPSSVVSNAVDMAAFIDALLQCCAGTDTPIVVSATLTEMLRSQYQPDPRLDGMGLAFLLERIGDHRVAGHDGDAPGFSSCLLIAPDEGLGVVAMANVSAGVGVPWLAKMLLRRLLGVPEWSVASVAPNQYLWPDLVGHYAPGPGLLTNAPIWAFAAGEVEVAVSRHRLVLRAISPVPALARGLPLSPVSADDPLSFETKLGGVAVPVVFARGNKGAVDAVSITAPALATLRRRSRWRSSRFRLRVVGWCAVVTTVLLGISADTPTLVWAAIAAVALVVGVRVTITTAARRQEAVERIQTVESLSFAVAGIEGARIGHRPGELGSIDDRRSLPARSASAASVVVEVEGGSGARLRP
jgi:CubicO group peptidase (beta-lactamase class C family)